MWVLFRLVWVWRIYVACIDGFGPGIGCAYVFRFCYCCVGFAGGLGFCVGFGFVLSKLRCFVGCFGFRFVVGLLGRVSLLVFVSCGLRGVILADLAGCCVWFGVFDCGVVRLRDLFGWVCDFLGFGWFPGLCASRFFGFVICFVGFCGFFDSVWLMFAIWCVVVAWWLRRFGCVLVPWI